LSLIVLRNEKCMPGSDKYYLHGGHMDFTW
jgi:hypothetical protein